METTDQITEGSPLKAAGDGTETVTAPSATQLERKSCKEGLGFSRMSHWRTAAFFLSLFLCLTVVFAFSFIIPCPERPQYNVTWSRDFPEAGGFCPQRLEAPLRPSETHRLLLLLPQQPTTSSPSSERTATR